MDGWKRQNDSLRTMFASVLFEPVPLRLLPTSVVPPKAVSPCRASATEPKRERTGPSAPDRPAGVVATTMLGVALVAFAAGALVSFGTDDFGLSPRARAMSPVEDADALQEERTFTARATETHSAFLSDLVRPVELTAADEPRLLRWLQHSLSGALRIPNLQSQGWTLIGGRVVPGQHGPAGFLVYGNGTDKLGLYVARTLGLPGGGLKLSESEGIDAPSIASWTEGPFSYALTTSRTIEWLGRNAEPLRGTRLTCNCATQPRLSDVLKP